MPSSLRNPNAVAIPRGHSAAEGGGQAPAVPPGQPSRTTGRWAELSLLVLALFLGVGGLVLTSVKRDIATPGLFVQVASLIGVALVVHLWVRFRAPWADPVLLPTAVALNGLGLAMIHRLDLAYEKLNVTAGYGTKQAIWTGIGVFLFCAVLWFRDYRVLRRWDRWAMWSGLVFLILPFVPGLGREINGARIWIGLGPLSFQPAELTKLFLAVFFASFLVANRDNLALAGKRVLGINLPRPRHLGPLLVVWGVSILVLVLQKDLGSSLLLFGLFVVTLYVATDRPSWLLIGAALFIPAAWFAATHLNHVQQRINGWLNAMDPEVYNGVGGSWQLVTGLFGMASGGIFGSGWGAGYPNFVTFANSDFIIASLGEELGLVGSLAILMLYLILIQRGLRTAIHLRDGFGKLLAVGLSFSLGLQVFVVIGGVTRLIPLTGLTAPFLAYGGSSLVANWMILALLVRLSDAARRPAVAAPRIIDTSELPTSIREAVLSATTPDHAEEDSGPDLPRSPSPSGQLMEPSPPPTPAGGVAVSQGPAPTPAAGTPMIPPPSAPQQAVPQLPPQNQPGPQQPAPFQGGLIPGGPPQQAAPQQVPAPQQAVPQVPPMQPPAQQAPGSPIYPNHEETRP